MTAYMQLVLLAISGEQAMKEKAQLFLITYKQIKFQPNSNANRITQVCDICDSK